MYKFELEVQEDIEQRPLSDVRFFEDHSDAIRSALDAVSYFAENEKKAQMQEQELTKKLNEHPKSTCYCWIFEGHYFTVSIFQEIHSIYDPNLSRNFKKFYQIYQTKNQNHE